MKPFLEDLASRRRFGMRPGLDAIAELCRRLGDPQRRFVALHVAGTNGKGAVAAMLDACLRCAGGRVGRYTSPHLVRLNERFFLDGAPIADVVLERAAEQVHRATLPTASQAGLDEITFFEALTATAFQVYAEAGVDCAVLECGLGGRLDATNVCCPRLCVITRIGLDHCDWLGGTVEQIAGEKAGIIKPGVPVVLGRNVDSIRAVVAARAQAAGAPFFYAPDLAAESEIPDGFALPGTFNRENAVTVLAALKVLSRTGGPVVSPDAVRRGLSSVVWPGRFQCVGGFLVDGAHNPPAAQALAGALSELPGVSARRLNLIAGFCGDKDIDEVLRTLTPFVRRGLAVRTCNPRSLTAAETARRMAGAGIAAEPCESLAAALAQARADEPADGSVHTLICGSLFLAGEALMALDAYPWPLPPPDDGRPAIDASELLRPRG